MKRYFTTKRKEEIYERDKRCVLGCGNNMLSNPHHIFYNHLPIGWKKGDDINGIWNGCILCEDSHNGFHHGHTFCNGKSLKENREYLEKLSQERYEEEISRKSKRRSVDT